MHKHDFRFKRAERALQQAFLSLLNKQSFREITVNKIIQEANVSRGTFYNHYSDKYELAEKMQTFFLTETNDLLATRLDNFNGQEKINITSLQNQALTIFRQGANLKKIQVGDENFDLSLYALLNTYVKYYLQTQPDISLGSDLDVQNELLSAILLTYAAHFEKAKTLPTIRQQKETLNKLSLLLQKYSDTI